MTSPPAPRDPAEAPDPRVMRASDADRERAAEVLREAAAEGRLSMDELNERLDLIYAAKTYAELAPVTADLPSTAAEEGTRLATSAGPFGMGNRFGGEATGTVAVAILGGFVRKGDWVAPAKLSAVAILGGGEIDLRDARFAEHTVTINAVTIMGGIQITVPEDADVQVNGIGIMGGFDHSAAGPGSPGGPRIVINGFAFGGGVAIERRPSDNPRPAVDRRRQGELNDLPPAEGGGDVLEDRLDDVGVVLDAELVGDGQQQRVGGSDGLVLLQLLNEDVRLRGI
jgi:hypothetical protein